MAAVTFEVMAFFKKENTEKRVLLPVPLAPTSTQKFGISRR